MVHYPVTFLQWGEGSVQRLCFAAVLVYFFLFSITQSNRSFLTFYGCRGNKEILYIHGCVDVVITLLKNLTNENVRCGTVAFMTIYLVVFFFDHRGGHIRVWLCQTKLKMLS